MADDDSNASAAAAKHNAFKGASLMLFDLVARAARAFARPHHHRLAGGRKVRDQSRVTIRRKSRNGLGETPTVTLPASR
jgi:hypothetical protein